MPRIVKVVIKPDISQTERDQNVDGLVQQLKLYYSQTREEHLRKLAVTLEDLAFRHSQTRDQYSYELESLSSQEVEKATQLYKEINASVPPNRQEFGSSQAFSAHMIGNEVTQVESNLRSGDSGEGYVPKQGVPRNDTKVRQQMARRRIMTRRRKRTKRAGKTDLVTQLQAPETAENPTQMEAERSGVFVFDFQDEAKKRGAKRCHSGGRDTVTGVAEWIDQFCNGNLDAGNVGLSFMDGFPQDVFGTEENNGIETCFSSSQSSKSEASARKRLRIEEESSN